MNIALVNEMAIFCRELDIDLQDAIRRAATKPFGFAPFYPGPGVGGHCIPIDPNYLSYKVRTLGYPFRFVELAQDINGRMPGFVTERAAAADLVILLQAHRDHDLPRIGRTAKLLLDARGVVPKTPATPHVESL